MTKHSADEPLVEDGAIAFRKLENFVRRVLSVPKHEIDKRLEKEKTAKKTKRSRR